MSATTSGYDISCMRCRECGHEDYCDSWQRDRDWVVVIERPVGATK